MACGLPVIVSDTCGASELIKDRKDGIILEKNRAAYLAESISLLEDSSVRSQIGYDAAVTAAPYSMEKHMNEVLNLYEQVIVMKKE